MKNWKIKKYYCGNIQVTHSDKGVAVILTRNSNLLKNIICVNMGIGTATEEKLHCSCISAIYYFIADRGESGEYLIISLTDIPLEKGHIFQEII